MMSSSLRAGVFLSILSSLTLAYPGGNWSQAFASIKTRSDNVAGQFEPQGLELIGDLLQGGPMTDVGQVYHSMIDKTYS
jgi:hypothetical protein